MSVVTESWLSAGWRCLRLENASVEAVVIPDKGGEVYELRSREHDLDVLWKAPWGLRPPPVRAGGLADSQAAWLDHYGGGWQELFPNGGDACTYAGASLPFHGEASVVPWSSTIVPGPGGVPAAHLEVRLARSPFRLQKLIWLEALRPVLHLRHRVVNEGAEAMPFMWGHHPAFGGPFLAAGCELDVPAATYEANEAQFSAASWVVPGVRSGWPEVARAGGGSVDLRLVPGPEARTANFGYLAGLSEGWYALRNPHLGLGVGLVWPRDVFPYVWLWQEFCGSPGYPWYGTSYVMGVEPSTSIPGMGLERALDRGTARWLQPNEALEAEVLAVLFPARGPVRRVTPDGDVETESA